MTRKQFFVTCASLGTVLWQRPLPSELYGTKEELAFVLAFNNWARTANHNGSIVDVKEIRAWHETEAAWNKLRKIVRQSYQ